MGFSYPRLPNEPTVHKCKFCNGPIRYIPGGHNLSALGWVHVGKGAWLSCPVPSGEARPA